MVPAEWKDATRELWRQWRAGRWKFITSTTTAAEMTRAPAKVRELFESTFAPAGLLPVNHEVEVLAASYLDARVLPGN